jgi:hypothetical protein
VKLVACRSARSVATVRDLNRKMSYVHGFAWHTILDERIGDLPLGEDSVAP